MSHGKAHLRTAVQDEMVRLQARSAAVIGADRGVDGMVDGALPRFRLRRLVGLRPEGVVVAPDGVPRLRYSVNSIAHLYDGVIPVVEKPPHIRASPDDPARVFVRT